MTRLPLLDFLEFAAHVMAVLEMSKFKSRWPKMRWGESHAIEGSSHICTATLRHRPMSIKPSPTQVVLISQLPTTFKQISLTTFFSSHPTTKMPVPMHSTSEKSTSTPVTAQTSSTTSNTSTTSASNTTHTEKTEQEKEMERLYEERMEEEYAKREGGA
jgi:hypothetical protein